MTDSIERRYQIKVTSPDGLTRAIWIVATDDEKAKELASLQGTFQEIVSSTDVETYAD